MKPPMVSTAISSATTAIQDSVTRNQSAAIEDIASRAGCQGQQKEWQRRCSLCECDINRTGME